MTRTVKWPSVALNIGKWLAIMAVVLAYGRQKDAFLRELVRTTRWGDLDAPRTFRNRDKASRVNVWQLPVHLYDRALADAVDTMKRWILAAIAQAHIQGKCFRAFEGPQRRYAFWLLRKFVRIGAVLRGEAPVPTFEISLAERRAVARLLRRLLRKALSKSPRVHVRRSFELDNSLYRFFTHQGRPYLSIASLIPGQRIVMPLKGFPIPAVTGNVRVVIHPMQHTVAVHIPVPVRIQTLPERPDHRAGGGAKPSVCGGENSGHLIQPERSSKGGPDSAVQPGAGETGCAQSKGSSRGEALDFRSDAGGLAFPAGCAGHGGSQSDARSDEKPEPLPGGLALDAVKPEGTGDVPVPSGRFPVGDGQRGLYLSGMSAVRFCPQGEPPRRPFPLSTLPLHRPRRYGGRDQRGAPVYRSRTPGTDSGLHAEGEGIEGSPGDFRAQEPALYLIAWRGCSPPEQASYRTA